MGWEIVFFSSDFAKGTLQSLNGDLTKILQAQCSLLVIFQLAYIIENVMHSNFSIFHTFREVRHVGRGFVAL